MSKKILVILMSLVFATSCFLSSSCKKKGGESESESTVQSLPESESVSEPASEPESEPESQEPTYAFDALDGYSVIDTLPLQITASSTVSERATPSSAQSSVVEVASLAQYLFKNVEINKYSSLIFFVKALDNSAFEIAKSGGNSLYTSTGSDWNIIEVKREIVDGEGIYRLYVNGAYITNPNLSGNYNELVGNLNGKYYFSELFAIENPDFVEIFEIIMQNPLDREVDDLTTEDYPCEEAIELNVHQIKEWGKVSFKDLKLAPYSKIKFYMKGQSSWISFKKTVDEGEILYLDNKDTHILCDGSWNEILIEKIEGGFAFYINGKRVAFDFKYNLSEIKLTLNKDDIIVSEVFAIKDKDYVEVRPAAITVDPLWFKTATRTENIYELAPVDYATLSHAYTVSSWCKSSFSELNLLEYEEISFYVRSAKGEWVTVEVAGKNVLACQDTVWHEVRLSKSETGLMSITVDGSLRSGKVTNLAQLSSSLTGGDVVYFSEIYGIRDYTYQKAEVTFKSGTGFTYKVNDAYVNGDKAILGKNTSFSFKVELGGLYNKSEITVKANGATVTAEGGLYTVQVDGDVEIEVLGVVENPLEDIAYVEVARNPFGFTGTEVTDDLGSGYSQVTTVAKTKWSANGDKFVEIDANMYSELRFFVKSANWFELGTPSKKTAFWGDRAETWMDVRLVKGATAWTVYINEEERGQIVLTNLKDDFYVRCGDATVYISELLGVLDTNA